MAWGDKKDDMGSHIEEVQSHPQSERPPPPQGAKGKILAHFKKWWWVHLILFLAGFLIVLLILIFVAFPKIAQHEINKSNLLLNAVHVTNPSPTGFHLFQNATVVNKSPYHPNLDAFNASMWFKGWGVPFTYAMLPAVHATERADVIVDADVVVSDLDAFIAYNEAFVNQENVSMLVQGRTDLHEMRFPTTNINYNQTVTTSGLNMLDGFNVTNFTIKLIPDPDGANMIGTVYIPNPSVYTLALGNLTFNTFLPATDSTPQTYIGNSSLKDVTLVPGNNTIPMRSIVNQSMVITSLVTSHKDGLLPVQIVGNESVYDGQHLVYYEQALQKLTQNVTLDVGIALQGVGLNLTQLVSLGGNVGALLGGLNGGKGGSSSSTSSSSSGGGGFFGFGAPQATSTSTGGGLGGFGGFPPAATSTGGGAGAFGFPAAAPTNGGLGGAPASPTGLQGFPPKKRDGMVKRLVKRGELLAEELAAQVI